MYAALSLSATTGVQGNGAREQSPCGTVGSEGKIDCPQHRVSLFRGHLVCAVSDSGTRHQRKSHICGFGWQWLPTDSDREFVESLMVGVTEPGKMAGWVAPPATGIHARPVDFEYVKIG